MYAPLITVVTPSLNCVRYVRAALESVSNQDYPAIEHIIVDGGSTDGTLDVLQSYPHLQVIHQPGEGMYAALNAGIRLARGQIIAWLNTDDLFAEGSLRAVSREFEARADAMAVSGSVEYFRGCDDAPEVFLRVPPVTDKDYWSRMVDTPATNGWFFRPAIFDQVGFFQPAYRYVADREFFIRLALAGIHPVACTRTLYRYRQHDASSTISAQDSRLPERGSQRIRVLLEDLDMLEAFLRKEQVPTAARRVMRRSHGVRAYRLAATALFHHQIRLTMAAAARGWAFEILWPLVFLRMAGKRLTRSREE